MPTQIPLLTILNVLGVLVMALFGVLLTRALNRQDQHDARIRALEQTVATKPDVERIHERIDELGVQMNEQHATILRTLVDWRNGSR